VPKKQILIVAHQPSENTVRLAQAALRGATHVDLENVTAHLLTPFEAQIDDVLKADAIILGTTENLAYMSGALKDFFDRTYNQVLEKKQGLPVVCFIRAGSDGTGTRKAIETIITGLKWRWVQEPLVCKGDWQEVFVQQVEELALTLAAQIDLAC
jgi:flavorubredoxin